MLSFKLLKREYKMKELKYFLFSVLCIILVLVAISQKSFSQVSDISGNSYKVIKIGNQEWTTENLNVEQYRNGDPIPQVQDKDEWENLTTGAWCYFENKSENGSTYGKLYNGYAITDSRGIAPVGWHIPGDEEWTKLTDFLGGEQIAGEKMKSKSGWDENGNGTNNSGFSGLPGGYRNHNGYFLNFGKNGLFWTSTEFSSGNLWFRNLIGSIPDVYRPNYDKAFGLSVRCVKD